MGFLNRRKPLIYMPRKRSNNGNGGGSGGRYDQYASMIPANHQGFYRNNTIYYTDYTNVYNITTEYQNTQPLPSFNAIVNQGNTHIVVGKANYEPLITIQPDYPSRSNTLKKVADALKWEIDVFGRVNLTIDVPIKHCFYVDPDNPIIYRLYDSSLNEPYEPGPVWNCDNGLNIGSMCYLSNTNTIEKIEDALDYYDIRVIAAYYQPRNGILILTDRDYEDLFLIGYVKTMHRELNVDYNNFTVTDLDINIPQQT